MITVNPNLFTTFGNDWANGKYSKLPTDSYEYVDIWKEQIKFCTEGVSIGGLYISGLLYSYINFGTIMMGDETSNKPKTKGIPTFRDIELEYDRRLWEAKALGKDLMLISGRRAAKTSFFSFPIAWSATFFDATNIVGAANSSYIGNAMEMVSRHLTGFIEKKTEFWKPIASSSYNKDSVGAITLGWKSKDSVTNVWTHKEAGIVHAINFGTNADASVGKSGWFVFLDEVGKFPNLITVQSSLEPVTMIGGQKYGMIIYMGTGNEMEKGSVDAAYMFKNPEAFNLLTFHDELKPEKKTAWFIPGYIGFDEYRDEFNNIDHQAGIDRILTWRDEVITGTPEKIIGHKQAYPLHYDDAFQSQAANVFPVEDLIIELDKLRNKPLYAPAKQKVRLTWEGTKVVATLDDSIEEVAYPVNGKKSIKGGIIIYERPIYINDSIPDNLYIAGTDPFHFDKEDTKNLSSLGSTFIYKRGIVSEEGGNYIVAEYTGRPATTDEYFEELRKLLQYYNAKTLHERSSMGVKSYFEQKRSLHLLADAPKILSTKLQFDYNGQRGYGLDMSSIKTKLHAIQRLASHLRKVDPDKPRIQKLNSEWLLQELISFDFQHGNFDRVSALALTILYDEELFDKQVELVTKVDSTDYDSLFKRHGWL
jgi:hypothetical protein